MLGKEPFFTGVSTAMEVTGVLVIAVGALKTLLYSIHAECSKARHTRKASHLDRLRVHFGAYLLLGLEFSVGADIVLTMLLPSYEGLVILGGLILIRTFIAFFIGRERKGLNGESKPETI